MSTPIWQAEAAEHHSHGPPIMAMNGVVKLLLGRRDINPDFLDNDGRTPLSCAARLGHNEVVKLLLESGDINPI